MKQIPSQFSFSTCICWSFVLNVQLMTFSLNYRYLTQGFTEQFYTLVYQQIWDWLFCLLSVFLFVPLFVVCPHIILSYLISSISRSLQSSKSKETQNRWDVDRHHSQTPKQSSRDMTLKYVVVVVVVLVHSSIHWFIHSFVPSFHDIDLLRLLFLLKER